MTTVQVNSDWAPFAQQPVHSSPQEPVQGRLDFAASAFEEALTKLEGGLAATVTDIADIARRAGIEEGQKLAISMAPEATDSAAFEAHQELLSLREALAASRDRETRLSDALAQTRQELDIVIGQMEAMLAR